VIQGRRLIGPIVKPMIGMDLWSFLHCAQFIPIRTNISHVIGDKTSDTAANGCINQFIWPQWSPSERLGKVKTAAERNGSVAEKNTFTYLRALRLIFIVANADGNRRRSAAKETKSGTLLASG